MPTDRPERVHLSVAEARALSERAMRGIGYEPEEARILADHVIDAALGGYEYSGLPKLLNVAEHPRFRAPRSPMRVLRETAVSVLFDGGNQSGMLGMYYATRAVIERAERHGLALVGVNNIWMSGRSAYYVEMVARAGLVGIHTVAAPPLVAPLGGARPVLGTNPIAFGFPMDGDPLVIDLGPSARSSHDRRERRPPRRASPLRRTQGLRAGPGDARPRRALSLGCRAGDGWVPRHRIPAGPLRPAGRLSTGAGPGDRGDQGDAPTAGRGGDSHSRR